MAKTGAGMGHIKRQRPKSAGAATYSTGANQVETGGASEDLAPDRWQLEQIIAGLSEGVILIEPDQTITYANEAAL